MRTIEDGKLKIVVAGPAGYGNNIYVVVDVVTGEAAFIDAPAEVEKSVEAAEAAGVQPTKILLTHGHGDHTASINALKERYGARLYANPAEPGLGDVQVDVSVVDGGEVKVGSLVFQVIAVPGHTRASTAFLCGRNAFVGDTLFPGGPGHSVSNEALREEILSITTRLYMLPDETVVWPGHGDSATIGASKQEYAIFSGKSHDPDLHGDVNWLES